MGKVPFGPSNPSRVPEPPATRMTPTSPAASASAPIPAARAAHHASPSVWGSRTTSIGCDLSAGGADHRVAVHQLGDQPIELIEVDRGDLGRQPRALVVVQLAPTIARGDSVHAASIDRQAHGRETSRAKLLATGSAALEFSADHRRIHVKIPRRSPS